MTYRLAMASEHDLYTGDEEEDGELCTGESKQVMESKLYNCGSEYTRDGE